MAAAASTEMKALTNEPQVAQDYEVFISYSHQNKDEALQMLKRLKSIDSSLNVFIDSSGLNTGASWQQSLYHAIGKEMFLAKFFFFRADFLRLWQVRKKFV